MSISTSTNEAMRFQEITARLKAAVAADVMSEETDACLEEACKIITDYRLDRILSKLVSPGERPEDVLDEFGVFMRAGCLGIGMEIREKLIERLRKGSNRETVSKPPLLEPLWGKPMPRRLPLVS